MNRQNSTTVAITILDKEFLINCPDENKDELLQSARLLDQRMRQVRQTGKVYGLERIAVMTALNLSYELLTLQKANEAADQQARALADRVDQVLNNDHDNDVTEEQ
ncbi:cell division protein ZapA [Pokkaliibacter sp. CJK22405]|uniref:cell division protein ZapA n=1 Tax=Pokkaliibacter sp. CJK22405 TaxID=3384615 RepID=UPI003984AA10